MYNVTVDTGSLIPQFLEDYLTKRDLPEVVGSAGYLVNPKNMAEIAEGKRL